MNIYSNSFFHRTREYDNIPLILEEGFKVYYCKEEIFQGKNQQPIYIGIPMISFCDIPLLYMSRNNYGKFGIGMSRSWGTERHLEPVLYYPNDVNCQSTKMILKAAETFQNKRKDHEAYRILGYSKPMSKVAPEAGQCKNNYIEREWRKVYANPTPLKWLTEEEYRNYRGDKNSAKQPKGTPLHFDAEDIDFIIVDNKNLGNLQDYIMNKLRFLGGGEKDVSREERWNLLSKILVYEKLLHNV